MKKPLNLIELYIAEQATLRFLFYLQLFFCAKTFERHFFNFINFVFCFVWLRENIYINKIFSSDTRII